MKKENEKYKIILAALLHDIGKFWQRADNNLKESINIKKKSEEHLKTIVPFIQKGNYERPGYQHAIWTYQFFLDKKNVFRDLGLWSEERDSIINIASNHHRPNAESSLQKLIQKADWWSSGIDRRKQEQDLSKALYGETNNILNWGKNGYKNKPLHSIFDSIAIDDQQNSINNHFFSLNSLSIENKDIFKPRVLSKEAVIDRQSHYQELWTKFYSEFDKLPRYSINGFITSLLSLLKKYTWCIPSSTIDLPNVSLFEHLKTTAALASCFFATGTRDTGQFNADYVEREESFPVLLCNVDLSGIQKFIYDISSSKAYTSLKGRSYYLQLLMNTLLQQILQHKDIKQTQVNIIYSSGGGAFLLLPNLPVVESALESIRDFFNDQCWKEYNGTIFAAVGWTPFRYNWRNKNSEGQIASPKSLANGKPIENLGELWQSATEASNQQKRQKFVSVSVKNFEKVFGKNGVGIDVGGELKLCAVTGEPLTEENEAFIGSPDNEVHVHKKVHSQIELGKKLKDSDILIHSTQIPTDVSKDFQYTRPAGLNSAYYLLESSEVNKPWLKKFIKEISFMNSTDFLNENTIPTGINDSISFHFYGGNKQPTIQTSNHNQTPVNATLEEICQINAQTSDYTKLGVLRMDVDNLGKIFIKGLPPKDRSFSSLSTLSFLLDMFFSGYINTIRNSNEYSQTVSVLYSGGDDLFAVGRWDSLINFAWDVRRKFEEYVGRNDISISGGLIIVDRKYPIFKAAALAGEAEKKAKSHNGDQKNALHIFGETISFIEEFQIVSDLKDSFINLIALKQQNRKQLSKSILHQIQKYKIIKDHNHININEEKNLNYSYKWHAAYYLKRLQDRYKGEHQIEKFLENFQEKIMFHNDLGADRFLDLAATAARWAELAIQLINNNKSDDYEKGMDY